MDVLGHDYYMNLALDMARAAAGQTGTNPAVGCVVVKDGRILGLGAHLRQGEAHAEVHALNMAGAEAAGSTVYVTLEPCSHHGRTPPCADRLIRDGVARVVVATADPNPAVAGRGIARLREHGIEVEVGVRQEEARQLNEAFAKYIVSRLPFVTLKTAVTLDGKIASRTGDSKWISGERSRAYAHQLRHRHQAILVGAETAIRDDPQLTARLPVPALSPIRVVVDSRLRIPDHARLLQDLGEDRRTILLTTGQASPERVRELTRRGAEVIAAGNESRVDLRLAMQALGERGIGSVLLEGGGVLNGAMLEAGLVDKVVLFIAPKLIGGRDAATAFAFAGFDRMDQAIPLERMQAETVGEDVMITGYVSQRAKGGKPNVYGHC